MSWPGWAWIRRRALPASLTHASTSPPPLLPALSLAALAALVFLRRPAQLLNPQLWAEDGSVFLQQAWEQGFPGTLVEPFSGYLHTFPRLAVGLALLFPLERAPLVLNSLAFLAQLAPLCYLLADRMRPLIPAFPVRLLAAFLLAGAPNSYATHANITNSQWNLAVAAVLVLLSRPPSGRLARGLDLALLALFSLTGPFSLLLLPLLPLLLRPRGGDGRRRWRRAPVAVVAAGALVQALFAVVSPRLGATTATGLPALQETLTILSLHAFWAPVLGIGGTTRLLPWLTFPAILFGLAVVAGLALLAVRRRYVALCVLLYLATVTIALSFLFPLNDLRLWLRPAFGPRYYYFATLFVIFAALAAAAERGTVRHAGRVLLGAVVLVGVPADFRHPRLLDAHFADQVAAFRTLPPGAEFFVPLNPTVSFSGMTLRKKDAERAPPPLSRLKVLPAAARASLDPVATFTRAGVDFALFSGWAVDDAAQAPAAGVYLRIDGKLFPAVYGERRPEYDGPGGNRALLHSGFLRYLPVSEIGRGPRSVALVVVAADGKSFFHPAQGRTIAIR